MVVFYWTSRYLAVCVQLKELTQSLQVQGAAVDDDDDDSAPATPARTPLRSGTSGNHSDRRSSSSGSESSMVTVPSSSSHERRSGAGTPASAVGSKRPPNSTSQAANSKSDAATTPYSLKMPAGPERDLCKELAARLEALLGENASLRARVEFLESTVRDLSGTLEERKELLHQLLQTQSPSSAGGVNGSSLLDPVAIDARVKSLVTALKGLANTSEAGATTTANDASSGATGAESASSTGAGGLPGVIKSPFGASPSSSFSALQAFSPPAKLFSITPEQSLIEVCLETSFDAFFQCANSRCHCSLCSCHVTRFISLEANVLTLVFSWADYPSRKHQTSATTCCCGPFLQRNDREFEL